MEMKMGETDILGKAQTVLGPIDTDELGITLAHEHILIDFLVFFEEPEESTERRLAHEPVTIENLWWIRQNLFTCLDNVRLIDEKMGIRETMRFKLAGGGSIVEMSNIGLGRDPQGLARIARATGLNIIMGAGFYVGHSQTEQVREMSPEQLAERIVDDIVKGVGDTGIKAGMIGEIGAMVPIDEFERKSLRAAAIAQQKTGAPFNIHSSHSDNLILDNIKIIKEAGADLSRVAMSHCDAWCITDDVLQRILDEGCYVEFDTFGYEGYFPPYQGRHFNFPTDEQRVKTLLRLIEKGYLEQLLVASDHCVKTSLASYGGFGYDHVLTNVVPLMKLNGISEKQIDTLLVENPKRLLTFAPANEVG
jgi:phosphotriesterase-related protein